jgi:putative transferase (TIGR04331 family)
VTTSFTDRFASAYLQRAAQAVGTTVPTAVLAGREGGEGDRLAGWWCATPAAPGVIVLPNPWDDRAAVGEADAYAAGLEARLLELLSGALDEAHGVARGPVWWSTILPHWLAMVVASVLDRALFVRTTRALAPDAPLLAGADRLTPPESILGASWQLISDAWSAAVIAALWDGPQITQAAVEHAELPRLDDSPAARLRRVARTGPHAAGRLATRWMLGRERGRRVVLLGGHGLSTRETLRLGLGVRQLPRPALRPAPLVADPLVRDRFQLPEGETEDERLLLSLLPVLLPRTLLDTHAALVAANARLYGSPVAAVDASYGFDDANLVYLARCRAARRPIGFAQHGGSTSQLRVGPGDRIEDALGHMRLSWGAPGGARTRTVGTPRLERMRATHAGGDDIVLIEGASPPISQVLRFTSTPLGNQVFSERALAADFVVALGASAGGHLVLKRFPRYTPEDDRPEVLAALRQAAATSATGAMQTARLAVLTYPDTPFIEALVVGVPTVGLWRTDLWEMREDARAPFEALAEAGVVHGDPAAAAAHVDAIHEDPAAWWETSEVRAAREAFVERFAPAVDWRARWREALEDLAA